MSGFQRKEQELFLKIADDITKYPDRYLNAGKWLDQYYGGGEFWAKKQEEIGQEKHELIEQIKKIEGKIEIESQATNRSILDETLNSLKDDLFIKKKRLEFISEFENERQPPIKERLAYALEDLYKDYCCAGVLSEQDSRALLLITWVATDAEADKCTRDITKFADCPWKTANTKSGLTRFSLATFLFFDLDIMLHYNGIEPTYELDLNYLLLVHSAWRKVEAEKELASETPLGSEQEAGPVNDTADSKTFFGPFEIMAEGVASLLRRTTGIVTQIHRLIIDEEKRFEAIPREVIRTKEEMIEDILPSEAKAYILESIEKLNELGRTYPIETKEITDKEIALCKKLAEYNEFRFDNNLDEIEQNRDKDTLQIEYIIHPPVKTFIKKNYADILEIRKEHISEESCDDILNNIQLSQVQKTALQSYLTFFTDGATKYPKLRHILLKWPLLSLMPKPPRELLDYCEPQEYEWMMKRRNSPSITDSVFSTPEIESTTWLIYPKGESWNKDSGIQRFRDLSIDVGNNVLGYDWVKLLYSYILPLYPLTSGIRMFRHEFLDWDGLFDEDYTIDEEGLEKELYNCYCITDVFYESVKLCTKLLGIEEKPDPVNECSHSPDYSEVIWDGTTYTFNKNQAKAVKLLWQAWEAPNKIGVSEKEIGAAVDSFASKFRLQDLFRMRIKGRHKYHDAWNTMIHHLGSGTYRLKLGN